MRSSVLGMVGAIQREQARMKPMVRTDLTGKRLFDHRHLKEVRESGTHTTWEQKISRQWESPVRKL